MAGSCGGVVDDGEDDDDDDNDINLKVMMSRFSGVEIRCVRPGSQWWIPSGMWSELMLTLAVCCNTRIPFPCTAA